MSSKDLAKQSDRLEEEVKASLVNGYLPCPDALKMAGRLKVTTQDIGYAADSLGVRVTNCQLGCFKFDKALHEDLAGKTVRPNVASGIEKSLVGGRLPCPAAHELGRELKVSLKEIGDAATRMKIKIIDCQLNCFV